jgi:formylglycine-generating enzyme required for sulfatase activity
VRLSPYWLGKTEVTVGQFRLFVNQTGYRTDAERGDGCWAVKADGEWERQKDKSWRDPGYFQDDGYPVVCVSWNDASSFAQWLSSKSGQAFTLPSEAQWEYACRAGGQLITYAWGNGDPYMAGRPAANIADESAKRKFSGWTVWQRYDDGFVHSAPVGRFAPNGLGLHDMTGNVWEWVQDVYSADAYRGSASDDPIYQGSGANRVYRGGGWISFPRYGRCSIRVRLVPGYRYDYLGFRLARTR